MLNGLNDSPAAIFFEQTRQSFLQGTSNIRVIEHSYHIGASRIQIRFLGEAMIPPLTRALAHLSIPVDGVDRSNSDPDLTVYVWDSLSTGVQMARPPWSEDDYVVRAEIKGYNNDRFHTAYDVWGGGLRLLDREQNLALFWTRDASQLPSYERGAPLRMIFNWWLRNQRQQLVHAAAVGTPDGGVLLAGKGGSGKSTTSVTCLSSSLSYASDDYCLLDLNSQPHVHSLYNSAKLEAQHARQFLPHLEPYISNSWELETEKALFFLAEHFSEKVTHGFPIKAVLLPHISGKTSTNISRCSAIEGLKALAPSTLFQLSGAGKTEFENISALVKQVPCYRLELGTDLSQIPGVITHLLKSAA